MILLIIGFEFSLFFLKDHLSYEKWSSFNAFLSVCSLISLLFFNIGTRNISTFEEYFRNKSAPCLRKGYNPQKIIDDYLENLDNKIGSYLLSVSLFLSTFSTIFSTAIYDYFKSIKNFDFLCDIFWILLCILLGIFYFFYVYKIRPNKKRALQKIFEENNELNI